MEEKYMGNNSIKSNLTKDYIISDLRLSLSDDIYRKKVLLGFYHYIMLSKKKNGLKIDSGSQYLSTPFNKLIFSYYKNFVPKERPPIVNREDI